MTRRVCDVMRNTCVILKIPFQLFAQNIYYTIFRPKMENFVHESAFSTGSLHFEKMYKYFDRNSMFIFESGEQSRR